MARTPAHPLSPEAVVHDPGRRAYRRKMRLIEFTHSSTRATALMVAAAALALVLENVPGLPDFAEFWHGTSIGFSFAGLDASISLEHFVNDFLMALFFLLVGLEIKFELRAGELTSPRRAVLPILAAVGGAVLPALIYLALTRGSGFEGGWGIPMSNDIAFCLGILALLGNGVPAGLRAFLSTLAIADDIIAIAVIAVFYTAELHAAWLAGAAALFALGLVLNRRHVYDLPPYVVLGLAMWVCVYLSGVHATLAGILLALTVPARSEVRLGDVSGWFVDKARHAEGGYDPGEPDVAQKSYLREVAQIHRVSRMSIPPVTRLDSYLHAPVYFFVLPLFAFVNAAVPLAGTDPAAIATHPVAVGVFFGLLLGKPLGIFLTSLAVVKGGLSDLPAGVRWGHVAGAAVLGGVGFTMAIFVTGLSFGDAGTQAMAKVAIVAASLVAGVAGFCILRCEAARDARRAEGGRPQDGDGPESESPAETTGKDQVLAR